MKPAVAFVIAALATAGCSSVADDGTSLESFDGMFTATSAGGDPTHALGTWGLTKTESGIAVEVRTTITATGVRLASRCTLGAQSVIAGISVAADVTETKMTVNESKAASQPIGQTKCQVQLSAGDAALTIMGGHQLNFGGIFLFDTKYAD